MLRYVTSLAPAGKKGSELLQFSGTLDPLSAKEMIEAIEEERKLEIQALEERDREGYSRQPASGAASAGWEAEAAWPPK